MNMKKSKMHRKKSCELFKSPKTSRASKYRESNSPKTDRAFSKKKKKSLRGSKIKLKEHYHHPYQSWGLASQSCSLSSLSRFIHLDLFFNDLEVQLFQVRPWTMLYQLSPQQLKPFKIPLKQNGIILVGSLESVDGLSHDILHPLASWSKKVVLLLYQQLLRIQLLSWFAPWKRY